MRPRGLISRSALGSYMEMYGGYGAYNVGPVATLRACLDEPGAKDENRMQCIQMLSFSQYMPYEEALYLTPALPLPNASTRLGTCHALSYGSRTSTGATGLAIDMIEDDDLLHLAAAAAERAPIRPLVQGAPRWCIRTRPSPSTTNAGSRALARRREAWLARERRTRCEQRPASSCCMRRGQPTRPRSRPDTMRACTAWQRGVSDP
jgi:hypothetical protein